MGPIQEWNLLSSCSILTAMTEQPLNLVLEQLRHIRATTDKTNTKILELEKHLIELRLQVAVLALNGLNHVWV